jgi:tetratricopeptide (TPR) repeat protein
MPLWGSSSLDLARFHAEAGTKLHQKGDLANALLHYTRALQEYPGYPGLLVNRGWLHYQQGYTSLALADLNHEVELGPPNSRTYEYRARVRQSSDDLEGALADYSKIVSLHPHEPRAYSLRGFAQASAGRMDRALDDCSFAIEIDSRFVDGFVTRAGVQEMRGDFDRAQEDATRALGIDAKNAGARYLQGRLLLDRKDWELARAHFERAVPGDSMGGWPRYALGLLLQIQGGCGSAAEEFEKSLEAAWGDPILRDYAAMHLWMMERRLGLDAEADGRFSDYLGNRPPPATGDWSGALAEFLLGRRSESALIAQVGAAPEPLRKDRRAQIPYYSGILKQLADDHEGARRAFQECLDFGVRHYFEWALARAELAEDPR